MHFKTGADDIIILVVSTLFKPNRYNNIYNNLKQFLFAINIKISEIKLHFK